ncbi:hypothetical protein WJX81_003692 [Elliptochloris bilobata]|uniref:RRM domain-containing protein n=1 Tax=Elliptochloris bilobata TaxID=381761 RepID=A0AAW1RVV3_9CHLO
MADQEQLQAEGEEAVDFGEDAEGEPEDTEMVEEAGGEAAGAPATTNGTAAPAATCTDPDDPLSLPPHGTEVFVGGVPRTATEAQLAALASETGEVHSVTLLKDPQNASQNRGFGFVKYKTKEAATAALAKLGGRELADFPGQMLRVAPSQSKHKLYVGNVPKDMSKDDLQAMLQPLVKGLEHVELLMSKEVPGQNRGFGFLEFYNHTCANAAKGVLSAPSYKMKGRTLTVSYAEPRQIDVQQQQQQQQMAPEPVKSVYVGNLPASATEAKLKEVFEGLNCEVVKVVMPAAKEGRPHREYGFVHFTERATTVKLVDDAEKGIKPSLDGNTLEVRMAKPQQPATQQAPFGGGGGRGFGPGAGRGPARGGFGGRGMGGRGRGYGGFDAGWGGGVYEDAYTDDGYGYGAGDPAAGYGDPYGAYGGYGMAPAAGALVPMVLPNGQVGYMLQGPPGGVPPPVYGAGSGPVRTPRGGYGGGNPRRGGRGGRGRGTPPGAQRYWPY